MISRQNLHIDPKTYILLKVFVRNVSLGGCLSKYRSAFIVYMFRWPPEVFNQEGAYRRTRTYGWEATAAPAATTSRDENFEFSCTFMFNSSSNYSLDMVYIVMNF